MFLTERRKKILELLDLQLSEIINYFPVDYEKIIPTNLSKEVDNKVIYIKATIRYISKIAFIRANFTRFNFLCSVDGKTIECVVFNQNYIHSNIQIGEQYIIKGKYKHFEQQITVSKTFKLEFENQIYPVYRLRKSITSKEINSLIKYALSYIPVDDVIPNEYIVKYKLINVNEAYMKIHFPRTLEDIEQSIRYFKYQEILGYCIQNRLLYLKENYLFENKKTIKRSIVKKVFDSLPFTLTNDQIGALQEIYKDLESERTMNRLLQGDVGSGKTMVALFAAFGVVTGGKQVALMAPTEVLARQHFFYFKNYLENFCKIELLISNISSKDRKTILERLEANDIDIIIGTQALIQEDVIFSKLGLVIIDEQQRFGVIQRQAILNKGKNIDFLSLTATPIPRTFANALVGNLDVSNLYTSPFKKSVETIVVQENSIKSILKEIDLKIQNSEQVFIVASKIEADNQSKAVKGIFASLNLYYKNKYRIGLLHGKLSPSEKASEMEKFKAHLYDILVATTVIEVGVDIKKATMMIIYNAENYGLSQLHQLRGRIGRDGSKSICYLLTDNLQTEVQDRLNYLANTNDGYLLSEYDLSNRGPGQMFGELQSGVPSFIFFDYQHDLAMLKSAKEDAQNICSIDNVSNQRMIKYVLDKELSKIKVIE
jgi:ATP-dependent DNA helicase RecG